MADTAQIARALQELEVNDVVRWTASGRYTYTAIKTPVGWFTSAKAVGDAFQRVPQVVGTEAELARLLAKREVSKIHYAMEWDELLPHDDLLHYAREWDELLPYDKDAPTQRETPCRMCLRDDCRGGCML